MSAEWINSGYRPANDEGIHACFGFYIADRQK